MAHSPQIASSSLRLRSTLLAALGCAFGLTQAQIVTTGGLPLASCPDPAFPYQCVVEGAAKVVGVVGGYEKVRISRAVSGSSLDVNTGASLILNSSLVSADLVVGDNPGVGGSLTVRNGGTVNINVLVGDSGGFLIGPFAGPSTSASISGGSVVTVNKPGGPGVGAAVGVGFALGSHSTLLLDGGIGDFGSPALGATLTTTGNLSIGRQGQGEVSAFRHATINANIINMSVIDTAGSAVLYVGLNSTVNAAAVYAGIGLSLAGVPDPLSPNHGTGLVDLHLASSFLNAPLTLGTGGSLRGVGSVAGLLNYGGLLSPGNSPGTLTIGSGGYTDVGGHLVIELGTSGKDKLLVQGPVSMNGTTIDFRFIEGFAPAAGFTFDFIDSTESMVDVHGLNYNFTGLAPGFLFNVQPGSDGRLVFTALTPGVSVPEPSSLALALLAAALGSALAGGVGSSRRRHFRKPVRH